MALDLSETAREVEVSAEEVIEQAKKSGARIVDLRFADLLGGWQHFSVPIGEFTVSGIGNGYGFDGSSIRGFQQIHESDMLLMPDPSTAFIDPALEIPTLAVICDVNDPTSGRPYSRDPRFVAKKAEKYLAATGIATTSYWGPEAEFYVFDSLRFDQDAHRGFYYIESREGIWDSGKNSEPNLAYRPRTKQGYFPVPPTDKFQDLRSEIMLKLLDAGVPVEMQHHEVGTAGQSEIDLRFGPLCTMADRMMIYKYVVKSVCAQHGLVATFMPKPIFQDNGSGMHVHQSLWNGDTNVFYDANGYALLSDVARWYIGGLLKHAPALLALAAPTTNSYRRLVPGYEAPINLVYSKRNRSACVRIPVYSDSPKARRVEFRPPDPSCNPYLCFAALLMAGLDGVSKRIEPPAPVEADLYELDALSKASIKSTPGSLAEVLIALDQDHGFLTQGGVFTEDLVRTWIDYKWKNEVEAVNLRPHPWEFFLYHDV